METTDRLQPEVSRVRPGNWPHPLLNLQVGL